VTTEVNFTLEIRGEGRNRSGENLGSGTMTKYPHDVIDATLQDSLTIGDSGEDQFMGWAHEKRKEVLGDYKPLFG